MAKLSRYPNDVSDLIRILSMGLKRARDSEGSLSIISGVGAVLRSSGDGQGCSPQPSRISVYSTPGV